jgi:hypothetical protein
MRLKQFCTPYPLVLSALFVAMSSSSSYAYLDAGTGSMILQVLLGGVAGLMIVGKLYWYKFRSMIGFPPKSSSAPEAETAVSTKAQVD